MSERVPVLLLLTVLVLTTSSCDPVRRALDKGDCYKALKIALRQNKHKTTRDQEKLANLGHAYRCVLANELDKESQLRVLPEARRWFALVSYYEQQHLLQQQVRDLILLEEYDCISPPYKQLRAEARREAGNYAYQQARKLATQATDGDKMAARRAFHWVQVSKRYTDFESAQLAQLETEMARLGTLTVQVDFRHDPAFYQEADIWQELHRHHQRKRRAGWLVINWGDSDYEADYQLVNRLERVHIGPKREDSDVEEFCKEIKVGERNVTKTVCENDTTYTITVVEEVFEEVCGTIESVEQSRRAYIDIHHRLSPKSGDRPPISWSSRYDHAWSNEYEVCSGDRRALPHSCSGCYEHFPSSRKMIRKAACSILSPLERNICSKLREQLSDNAQGLPGYTPLRPRKLRKHLNQLLSGY